MHFLFVRRIILRQILEAATDDYAIVGISNDPFGILRIVVMKFEQLMAFLKFSDTELRHCKSYSQPSIGYSHLRSNLRFPNNKICLVWKKT